MTPNEVQKNELAGMLVSRWEKAAVKMADLAEAVPERLYGTRPADAVRTFADVLRHVAFWNDYVAASASGLKADDSANELPEAQYSTKKQIVEALKQSASQAMAALHKHEAEMSPETAEMTVSFLEHTSEHYGQLVVYARLHGVVPPVSRG